MVSIEPNHHHLPPAVHHLIATVLAPACALSGADGQIGAVGMQGVFVADTRVLAEAFLRVGGHCPDPLTFLLEGPGLTRYIAVVRALGDGESDPTVRVERLRQMTPDGMVEEIRIASTATAPLRTVVTVDLSPDLAPLEHVKAGGAGAGRPAQVSGDALRWADDHFEATVGATGPGSRIEAAPARLVWTLVLPPDGQETLRWQLRTADRRPVVVAPSGPVEWLRPVLTADDRRLVRLIDQSLDDLESLRLAEPATPGDTFIAAGVPWFLTLFGRDSLWAARMLLPLGTGLAAGTLRTLARRQGRRIDPRSGEAPGKIMHELRREDARMKSVGWAQPATYYGTVDATPLWISLLHDAWRWGMPADDVVALLPNLEAALRWLAEHADPDRDGFIEYVDESGRGLANQGWKDSGGAIRFRDGHLATPPIALCEVQGYAFRAAVDGAHLLDAFGRPDGDRWRGYAADLAERFRARFWVDGPHGRHPALALDRDKRPVDSLTSNIGHLLGTGLLTDEETAAVVARLMSAAMSDTYGLRTMSTQDTAYRPLAYHCGAVWPHDTAIALLGLATVGAYEAAAQLAEGLLVAAEAFEYRLPEMYGGDSRDAVGRPVPHPGACRPQAWSAAAAVAILQAALGLSVDVPGGELRVNPLPGAPLGAIAAGGLRVAGTPIDIAVTRDGEVSVGGLPPGMRATRVRASR